MISILLFFLFSILSISNGQQKFPMEWTDCGTSDRRLRIDHVKIMPEPIIIQSKTPMNISVDVKLLEEINNDVTISIKVWRFQKLLLSEHKFQLPCLDGVVGSCRLKYCDYFNDRRINKIFKTVLGNIGKPSECPTAPDHFDVKQASGVFDLDTFNIPKTMIRLASGNYEVEVRFADKKQKPFGCFRIKSHIQFKV